MKPRSVGTTIPGWWEAGTNQCFAIGFDGRFAGTVDLRLRGSGRGVVRRALDLLLDWAFDQREPTVRWLEPPVLEADAMRLRQWREDDAPVGYWAHPGARGRGVMSAAMDLAAAWSLRDPRDDGLGLRRLFLLTAVDNADNAPYDRLRDDPQPSGAGS